MKSAEAQSPEANVEGVDPAKFRETLGHYPTGVVVVTAIDATGAPQGMVIGSFTSVSLDPPLVAYLPGKTSGSYQRIRTGTSFCINVLGADQEALCRTFASRSSDKFAGISWSPAPSGAPVLDGAVAWIDCFPEATHDGGDHDIVLGRVSALDVHSGDNPLLFFQGGYGRFNHRPLVAADRDLFDAVRIAESAREDLQRLADRLSAEVSVIASSGKDLVYVAAAAGPNLQTRTVLGTRFPMMAPFGELHLSGCSEEDLRAWVHRSLSGDDEAAEKQVVRARQATQRGWSASVVGGRPEGELRTALRAYSDPALTPARHRQVEQVVAQATAYYQPLELEAGARYDLHSLMVSVPRPDGRVDLVLRISQVPSQVEPATVEVWLAEMRLVAERLASGASTAR